MEGDFGGEGAVVFDLGEAVAADFVHPRPSLTQPKRNSPWPVLLEGDEGRFEHVEITCGTTLLTGICFCAACGGGMTLRTGKFNQYRYYTCGTKARQGSTGCKGRTIPMRKLDDLVAEHLEARLLDVDMGDSEHHAAISTLLSLLVPYC